MFLKTDMFCHFFFTFVWVYVVSLLKLSVTDCMCMRVVNERGRVFFFSIIPYKNFNNEDFYQTLKWSFNVSRVT